MSFVIPDTDENRNPIYVNTTKLLVKSSDERQTLQRIDSNKVLHFHKEREVRSQGGMFWSGYVRGTTGEIHLTNVSAHGFANSSAGWTAGGTGGDFITPGVDPSGLSAEEQQVYR